MIYTDKTHLVADTLEELHRFASKIGLKRIWFQNYLKHPHYDLTTQKMAKRAVRAGAKVVDREVVLEISKASFDKFVDSQKTVDKNVSSRH